MKSTFAQSISITDESSDVGHKKIILGISGDENLHYEDIYHGRISQQSLPDNNFRLYMTGIGGTLLIPKGICIEMTTDKDLEGVLASPMHIIGKGDVDLEIKADSQLELCVETKGILQVNNHFDINPKLIKGYETLGWNIQNFTDEYIQYQMEAINKRMFMDDDLSKEFPLEPSKYFVDICQAHNLVYIQKEDGITNLLYFKPEFNKNRIPNMIMRDSIKHLQIGLRKALIEEEYERASQIKQKIDFYETQLDIFSDNDMYVHWINRIFKI